MKVNKSIMKPFFTKKLSKPEKEFINYLETSSKVDWWYRNGDQDNIHFAIPYGKKDNQNPFYVDFIVCMKNGKLGFVDTKSGWTIDDAKFSGKIEGLRDYIKQDQSYSGGIISNTKVDCSGSWKIFQKNSKLLKKDDFSNWDDLDF